MENIIKEIQNSILTSSNIVLNSNLKKEYQEIADYTKREIEDLKKVTSKRIEYVDIENIDDITELYDSICSDYYNTYKIIYSIINCKVNELNKKGTDYIENDIFKLVCVTYAKHSIDTLFSKVMEKFNLEDNIDI